MIKLADKKQCTGCTACYSSCARQAIQMIENSEGFRYPFIDQDKCVGCGLCEKLCPELKNNRKFVLKVPLKVYAVISNKDASSSSSGGAFSAIARCIIKQGGVIFGATMDEYGNCFHTRIDSVDELPKIKGSKYVQSNLGDTFIEVRRNLRANRKVLFVGTGCQVSGLYSFLKKKHEGLLYTIDLVCHGVPSNKSFKAYLEKIKQRRRLSESKLQRFAFRKLDGWAICPTVQFTGSKKIYLELSENAYMNGFFKGILFRESCYSCSYCNTNRSGTFTLADFWGIGKYGVGFKRDIINGVSLLIDNHNMIHQIELEDVYIEERPFDEAIAEQDNLKHSAPRHPLRDTAVNELLDPNLNLVDFCKNNDLPYKKSFSWRISIFIKHALLRIGLFNFIKKLQYHYRKK